MSVAGKSIMLLGLLVAQPVLAQDGTTGDRAAAREARQAQQQGRFEQTKQAQLARMGQRQECVRAAQTPEAMRACREAARKERGAVTQ